MRFTSIVLLLLIPLTASSAPDAARQDALRALVAQDCGACHGLTLKGGLGPALTPQALAGKPDALLLSTVLDGRPGTAMPPWRPFLSEAEARWIIEQLRAREIRP